MAGSKKDGELQPIIIKKIKKGGGGHHGGAWKVAYADFVTAMMAFFLLLWLLNVTTDEARTRLPITSTRRTRRSPVPKAVLVVCWVD